MNHVPFADEPAKMAYMWRDVARRAEMYGIPARLPAPYPAKQSIVANLVALVGMQEGWGIDFVCAAYRNWFQRGEETGSEPNLSHSLREVGEDPARVLALAESDATRSLLVQARNLPASNTMSLPPHSNAIDAAIQIAAGVMTDRSARNRTGPEHDARPCHATRRIADILTVYDRLGRCRSESDSRKSQQDARCNPGNRH
jgi:hypothetical protein